MSLEKIEQNLRWHDERPVLQSRLEPQWCRMRHKGLGGRGKQKESRLERKSKAEGWGGGGVKGSVRVYWKRCRLLTCKTNRLFSEVTLFLICINANYH